MKQTVKSAREAIAPRSRARKVAAFVMKYYIQWLLVIAYIVLGIANPRFVRLRNIESVLLQSAFAGIGAAGMTILIVSGAFDLSVAGLLAVTGITLGIVSSVAGALAGIIAALAVGTLLGFLNGVVVTKMKIPAFIATLGMMNVYLGVAFIWTNGQVIAVTDPTLRYLGTSSILGFLPIPFVIMIVIYVLGFILLSRTRQGRHIRSLGSSETASRVAGIPVTRVRVLAFVVVGLCTAIGGILLTGELSSANGTMATGYELSTIAIVVVGGTSLAGGKGTMFGSFTGAVFFAAINNALNIFGVGAYWQYVVSGFLLISAVGVQAFRALVMEAE